MWCYSKPFDHFQLPGEVATFGLVEPGSELPSAFVKAGIRKHFFGEENFLVGLAGGRDPSLKLGLQLRGAAISFRFLGLRPFGGLLGSDCLCAVTDRWEAESPLPSCHLLLTETESLVAENLFVPLIKRSVSQSSSEEDRVSSRCSKDPKGAPSRE